MLGIRVVVCLAAVAGAPALSVAQEAQPTEVPCAATGLTIQIDTAKCYKSGQISSSMDKVPGVGPMSDGPTHVVSVGNDFRMSVQALVAERSDMWVNSATEAEVENVGPRWNGWTRSGSNWSPVRLLGNAWVMTFQSGSAQCLFFDNYGPVRGDGYVWSVRGAACRAGGVYTDDDIRKVFALVTSKAR